MDEATHVQQQLAAFRASLDPARAPDIDDEQLRRNTSLRAEIGGVPTAWRREELHLRTLARRGEVARAAAEDAWASQQFKTR